MKDRDNKTHSGISVSLINAEYEIDISKPCKHNLGNIDECGNRKEGTMFPYCAMGDIGENRCSQVKVELKKVPIQVNSKSELN